MKKFTYLFLFLSVFSKAQTQVNLQTGSAVFSLPMFNWQDNKSSLYFNMSLNYNSSNGLKVNEIASNIGQGWNLNAGGMVTRIQVGEPDDQYPKDGIIEDVSKYPAGYLYNSNDPTKGCPKALTKYPIFEAKDHIYKQHNSVASDRELDYFAFNFNGKNGLFVLNKADNSGYQIGDSKIKIWFTLSPVKMVNKGGDNAPIRTRISTFYIKDENGLTYRFGNYQDQTLYPNPAYGLTKVLKTAYCDVNGQISLTQPGFKGGNVYYQSLFEDSKITDPYIINSWFLTEIYDELTNSKITFEYTNKFVIDPAQLNISYYQEKDYSIISRKETQSQVPELLNVKFPDNHLIHINYGAARLDLKPATNTEQIISSIDISYSGRPLSRYELKNSYFILNRYGIPVSDFEKSTARLCLLSIKKYGVDLKGDDNPYMFDYYIGSDNTDDFVPPYSFPLKDIWGYYNGINSTAYDGTPVISGKPISQLNIFDINNNNDCKGLCFLKNGASGVVLNSKSGYAKNGLLRQIVYPTGGTLTYDYIQNRGIFINGTNTVNTGGVHVTTTSSADGGYSNGCNNQITTEYKYVLDDETSSSLWGLEKPVNTTGFVTTSSFVPELRHHTFSIHNLPFGNCSYKYQYPGIMYEEEKSSTKWIQVALAVLSDVLDVVSTIMEIKDIVTVASAGSPVSLILDIVFGIADLLISCLSNPPQQVFSSTIYYNFDLNGINPLPTQFKRVEIIPNTGDVGKTVETFTSSDDLDIWVKTNPDFTMQQRFAPWAYGLPKFITVFNVNGDKVSETENDYVFDFDQHFSLVRNLNTPSCNCTVKASASQRSSDWSNSAFYDGDVNYTASNINNTNNKLNVNLYDLKTGRAELTQSFERTFSTITPNKFVETKTNYSYNQDNFQIREKLTTQSNGDQIDEVIKYSYDYNGGLIDALKANNMLIIPVETRTSVISQGSSTFKALNETVTEFTQLANNNIKPGKTLVQRFSAPNSSATFYQGPNSNTNYSLYNQTQSFIYDANSNLTGIKDEGAHSVANIYDYSDKYIVASVINADPNTDKPAYTSFETSGLGGWVLTGSASYNTTKAITGNQSFNLSSGTSLKVSGLNTAKAYKLSFWATNSGVSISGGATLVNSSFTANGFTYYEYDIAQGTSTVTVSGTSTIDELRLYPKTARMRTTAYDPLIGKTSECDENNRINYYEYDDLGRLRFIKDETKNIVKMHEYNTVSNKQSGCPGIYYNHLIKETFIKSNCGAGYQGNPVTYTVPANKYNSLLSQADADQKAENELMTTGQANADNTAGACSLIYYNKGLTKTFYTQGCPVTQYGAPVSYSVPANRYSSLISQNVVDQMEQDDMDANGQANANNAPNASCIATTDPFYEAVDPASSKCQTDQFGSRTGHVEFLMIDINPNSSTYNQPPVWKDGGVDEGACPHDEGSYPSIETTSLYSQVIIRHGVEIYQPGTLVTVTVTLNTSDPSAKLEGNLVGTSNVIISVITNGQGGNFSKTYTVTVPQEGYISWQLKLTGTKTTNNQYISSNMSFTP